MIRKVYKLKFRTGVHFGNGSLSGTKNTFTSDVLFSAMCKEAIKLGNSDTDYLNKFVEYAENDKIRFSDAFPYIDGTLFIPKPFIPLNIETESNSVMKKAYKKLKYLPSNEIDKYMSGKLDVIATNKKLSSLGKSEARNHVAVRTGEDPMPYYIGIYRFSEKAGLYIIAEFENDETKEMFDNIFRSLSYTGIGGKLSSGLGKFDIEEIDIPNVLESRIENSSEYRIKLLLSGSIAADDEIEDVLSGESYYRLEKKSGFVSSETYSNTFMKKYDLYVFRSGSCFEKEYKGSIRDVSIKGTHPVYRYAKPLFMGVI